MVWYTSLAIDHATRVANAFSEKFAFIKVDLWRAGTGQVLTKILAEARANRYPDVTTMSDLEIHIMKEKGLFGAYFSPEREAIPQGFKDKEGYWTNFYDNIQVIAYNTKLVPADRAPKNYQDLLHPQWKGRMGMDSDEVAWVANMLRILGKEKGADFMRRLNAQNITFRNGHTLLAQLLAAGEISICVVCYNYRIEGMKLRGAPVEWVGGEPIIAEQHPLALFARAPHPHAARLFVDFSLSKEGGQKVMQEVNRVPARRDVEPSPPRLTRGLKIYPSDPTLANHQPEILKQYQELFPAALGR
ncbi:MAG: extracellular solute-binding protein [Deltaproteobacteria bacterium]|nr:extracellular solute-binding protein [Deltaproteobacteria bacterium]